MNRETARSLPYALDVCSEIEELTRGVSLEQFKERRLLYLSIERLFEIAGEAFTRARKYDRALVESIPESQLLIGMRNRIAHDYENIRLDIVWETATYDVPQLVRELDRLLRTHGHLPETQTD